MISKFSFASIVLLALTPADGGCDDSTDTKQSNAQAQALSQANAQIGMPAINDFSEKRMMKDIYELRDKPFPTHAYIVNEMTGCLMYLGPSMGYGLPYSAQYTAPERWAAASVTLPQAEPNGLFMPSSAEGTWIMLKSPTEDKVQPVYVEPRVVVSPFRLTAQECASKVVTPVPAPSSSVVAPTKKP